MAPAAEALRFEVLGPVRAWRGDNEIPLGSPQQRAVLTALLLHEGAVLTLDQLVAALWGDLAPPAAGATIRTYVSRLRRALAGGGAGRVITSMGGGYAAAAAAAASDLAEFERLVRAAREAGAAGDPEIQADRLAAALALWKGSPLTGVRAEYAEHERVRLRQRRLTAVEEFAAAQLAVGRPAEAAALLTPVVAEEPLREQTRGLLMVALYRSGRQAEALGVYQDARQLLADELGLEPGPGLQRTQRRILASDPALESPHPHPRRNARAPGFRPAAAQPHEPAASSHDAHAARLRDAHEHIAPAAPALAAPAPPSLAQAAPAAPDLAAPAPPSLAQAAPAAPDLAAPAPPALAQAAPALAAPAPPSLGQAAPAAPALAASGRAAPSPAREAPGPCPPPGPFPSRPVRGPAPAARPAAGPPLAVARPMQLPPDLDLFTGHAELVRRVGDALTTTGRSGSPAASVPVLGLSGPPGVGKTALAVRVGHAVAADFPDGQFFVDLGGCAGDREPPATTAGVLACLLRGVGVADQAVPASAAERAALWRSVTAGRRLLLVLDGVASAGHVQDVLPGSGGPAVLVTSRRRLFGPAHAQWERVGVLPDGDALALLGALAGRERIASEPVQARRLVALTGGLPHVVHVMAARLASHPWWSLATSLERLSGRAHGAGPNPAECADLAARYGSAFRGLEPGQARALRLLAVPEVPDISLGAAAALLGRPRRETEALLESLADLHLIEAEPGDRYRFLYPLRVFARSRALLDEGRDRCDAALARLTAFYAATARNALRSLDAGVDLPEAGSGGLAFAGPEPARAWLRAEQRQFRAVLAQSSATAPPGRAGARSVPAGAAADVLGRLTGLSARLLGPAQPRPGGRG